MGRFGKVFIVCLFLMLVLAMFSGDFSLAENQPRELENLIDEITVKQLGPMTRENTFGLHISWKIDSSQECRPGDYFILGFSDEIDLSRIRGRSVLLSYDGELFARGELDRLDRKIKFTFTEEIKDKLDISGYFEMEGLALNIDKADPNKGVEKLPVYVFDGSGNKISDQVTFNNSAYVDYEPSDKYQPDRESNYDKIGQIHREHSDAMYWYVYINGRAEEDRYRETFYIRDSLGEGHSIETLDSLVTHFSIYVTDKANDSDDGIKVYHNGKVLNEAVYNEYIKDLEFDKDYKAYSLKFNPVGSGGGAKALRIYYHTVIDGDVDPNKSRFENDLNLEANIGGNELEINIPRYVEFGVMRGAAFGRPEYQGNIEIEKVDHLARPIKKSGVEFEIEVDENHLTYYNQNFKKTSIVTDENGLARLDGIYAGIYKIREIKGPDGYIRDDKPRVLVVNFSDIENMEEEKLNMQKYLTYLKNDRENGKLSEVEYQRLVNEHQNRIDILERDLNKIRNKGISYDFRNIPTEKTQFKFKKIWDIKSQDKNLKAKLYLKQTSMVYDDQGGLKLDSKKLEGSLREISYSSKPQELVWENLDKYNSEGEAYIYTVHELGDTRYRARRTSEDGELVIINSDRDLVKKEKVRLKIKKEWQDADSNIIKNEDIDFDSISVLIKRDGKDYLDVDLFKDQNWEYRIDLPKYREEADGLKDIVYSIEEIELPGFKSTVSRKANDFTLVNKKIARETRNFKFNKKWLDRDGGSLDSQFRPENFVVDLYRNGKLIESKSFPAKEDNQSFVFEDLFVFDDRGQEFKYTIKEREMRDFTSELELEDDNIILINKRRAPVEKDLIDIRVVKEWLDEEDLPLDPEILPGYAVFELLMDGEDYLIFKLEKNKGWEIEIPDLEKYRAGREVDYQVRELFLDERYEASYQTLEKDGKRLIEVKNIRKKSFDLSVIKRWFDKDGTRELDFTEIEEDSLNFKLLADGELVKEFSLGKDNNWRLVINDLDRYKDGKEVKYEVLELGFQGDRDISRDGDEIYVDNYLDTVESPDPGEDSAEKVEIRVKKIWEGPSEEEKVSIAVIGDNEVYGMIDLDSNGDWSGVLGDLPKFREDGSAISYSVRELFVPGYSSEVTSDGEYSFIIKNTSNQVVEKDLTRVFGQKKWEGREPISIDQVEIILLKNEDEYLRTFARKADSWKFKFENLPKFDDSGKPYVYRVKEGQLQDYDSEISGNQEEGFEIVNKRRSKMDINISKEWIVSMSEEDLPDYVYINLYRNSKHYITKRILKADGWKLTISNLDKYYYIDGEERIYKYSIKEEDDPSFDSIIDGDPIEGFTIYNIEEAGPEESKKKDIRVVKEWIGIKKDFPEVFLILYRDGGEEVSRAVLKSGFLEHTFEDLEIYDEQGKEISYYVSEKAVEDFESEIIESEDGFTIINKKINKPEEPEEKPEEPEEKPEEPEEKPEEPEEKPEKPEEKPEEPEEKPEEPEEKPEKPEETDDRPEEGEGRPEETDDKSEEGEEKPEEADDKSEEPGESKEKSDLLDEQEKKPESHKKHEEDGGEGLILPRVGDSWFFSNLSLVFILLGLGFYIFKRD